MSLRSTPVPTGRANTGRIAAAVAAIVTGLVLLVAPVASAEAQTRIADAGWWWRAQTGVLVEVPLPPNVEEGQLSIQSTVEGEQAIAAVSAVIAEGQTNPVLTLDVADGGAGAVLLACQAGSTWVGEDGGRWDARPLADCTTSVTGIASDDGAQWTFPLGTLQFNDKLNVVLVPGQLADTDAPPSFSIVFEEPTAADIATVSGAAPRPTVPPTTAAPAPAASPTTAPAPSGGGSTFTPAPAAPTPPPATTPVVLPAQPVLEDSGQGLSPTAPIVSEAEELAVGSLAAPEPRTLARLVGLLVLAGGVAGVFYSRQAGMVAPAATAATPVTGGLARFRAERTSEPDPVS